MHMQVLMFLVEVPYFEVRITWILRVRVNSQGPFVKPLASD